MWFGFFLNIEAAEKVTWIFDSNLSVVRNNCRTKPKKNRNKKLEKIERGKGKVCVKEQKKKKSKCNELEEESDNILLLVFFPSERTNFN